MTLSLHWLKAQVVVVVVVVKVVVEVVEPVWVLGEDLATDAAVAAANFLGSQE